MGRIVDGRGFAFGIKWIAAGATAIGTGAWSYTDKALSEIGIGWRMILAGCIMLPIGFAVAINSCREQNSDQAIPDSSSPIPQDNDTSDT